VDKTIQNKFESLPINIKEEMRRRLLAAGLEAPAQAIGILETECEKLLSKFLTCDASMVEMKKVVLHLSDYPDPVYIHGETGTGKELIARSLHGSRTGPFVPLNCAALNQELFESELFGHKAFSFTGSAAQDRIGMMEFANNGTLFLDEIAELALPLQAKLLRAIQEKMIRRVGSNTNIPIPNVRIVAATHKHLETQVKDKLFREDLYWRLCTYTIKLSPLRERRNDIAILLDNVFDKDKQLSDEVRHSFQTKELTGNVRELEFLVKRELLRKKLALEKYNL